MHRLSLIVSGILLAGALAARFAVAYADSGSGRLGSCSQRRECIHATSDPIRSVHVKQLRRKRRDAAALRRSVRLCDGPLSDYAILTRTAR